MNGNAISNTESFPQLLQLFAQALYVLNRFVLAMIDWGYVDRRSYEGMFERILFPPEFTQHDVTRDFVGKLFRVKHQSTQSVGKSFRITRFNSAVSFGLSRVCEVGAEQSCRYATSPGNTSLRKGRGGPSKSGTPRNTTELCC